MKNKVTLSIIIVHYIEETLLFECLQSIFASKFKEKLEVIVVDNGSKLGFQKRLEDSYDQVRYCKPEKNLGYGAGNNFGALIATGNWLFFLNPDTQLHQDTLSTITAFINKHSNLGVVAPTLLHKDNSLFEQQGSLTLTPLRILAAHSIFHRIWPSNSIAQNFWLAGVDQTKDRRVEVVPGTALLIPKNIFYSVGRFDPQFFLYFEESDICRRILEMEKEIWMIGEAKIIHHWEGTTKASDTKRIFQDSLKKYLHKYYNFGIAKIVYILSRITKWGLLVVILLLILIISFVAYKEHYYGTRVVSYSETN